MEKDKINQVIDKVASDVAKNINDILTANIQKFYDELIKENIMEQFGAYSLYIATMTTALHMSIDIMRKSLCELLCTDREKNNATE